MASGTLDAVLFNPTAGGTTDWTYSSAVTGYQSPAAAGAVDTTVYFYRAYSSDLTQWEEGFGAWTASGGVLARTTVLFNSAGNTSKISFTNPPFVAIVAPTSFLRDAGALFNTGVVPIARLATGTPTGSKFVRDDNTLQAISQTRVYLGRTTISTGASTVDFTGLDTTTYKRFEFRFRGLLHQDTSQTDTFEILFGTGGSPTWDTTNTHYYNNLGFAPSSDGYQGAKLFAQLYSASAPSQADVVVDYLDSSYYKKIFTQGISVIDLCGLKYASIAQGSNYGIPGMPNIWTQTTAVTAVRFQFTRSAVKTFAGGTVDLYAEKLS